MISSPEILKAGILIVDDQEAHSSLLEQILRGAGYVSVTSTNDPREVCEMYRKNRYSLILLDLQMPGLDGFQVMEGLKAIETEGYLPVLALTAQPDHKLRALKAGARDFVSKPFDLAEVLMRVYNMLEVRLLHMEAEMRMEQAEKREEVIRFNELRYRSLVEAMTAIVWSAAASGEFEVDQPAWTAFTGQSCKELRGWGWLDAIHPDDQAEAKRTWTRAIANRSMYKTEHRLRSTDHAYHDMMVRAVPILAEDGAVLQWIGIHSDITEKKNIEAQFMRAQRMESIGTLAGGIAHDLNNILTPIMMSIELLKKRSDDPQTNKILETIEISAKRGADIVRQVLSFARGLEGQRIEVQLKHLVHELETIIKDTFPKDIQLQFSIPNDTWTILGDPTQVHQILLNLCLNARDAMPAGGTLIVEIENCVLDEQYVAMNVPAKPGHYVKINVTDSGTGMSPGIRDKIFEPFFTTKELNKGTGLGLSTVMAIVKSHEGIIQVYSELGKGTTFNIYLPAMGVSSEAPKDQSERVDLPRGKGETILVVDDEASVLSITSETLQTFGYRVLTATDGAEAVAIYAEHKHEIAVVLTDMSMPIMDGSAEIRALMRINPAIKIVAASGFTENNRVTKVIGAGVKHFLTKPYTAGTLLKTMRAILDES
jgi:PAS domain S-box-containing protein